MQYKLWRRKKPLDYIIVSARLICRRHSTRVHHHHVTACCLVATSATAQSHVQCCQCGSLLRGGYWLDPTLLVYVVLCQQYCWDRSRQAQVFPGPEEVSGNHNSPGISRCPIATAASPGRVLWWIGVHIYYSHMQRFLGCCLWFGVCLKQITYSSQQGRN